MSVYLFNLLSGVQAPQDIDPYDSSLNSGDVYSYLTANEQNAVDDCVDYIVGLPLTKDGRLYSRDKKVLNDANVEVKERYSSDPQDQDKVYIEVSVPTLEERAMPDNDGYHTLLICRHFD